MWEYIGFALSAYLALVLFTSAAAKLISISDFRLVLQRQGFLPRQVIPVTAWAVALLEASIVLLLFVPETATSASGIATLMLAGFTIVTVALVAQGRDAECGCFGLLYRERMSGVTVARDLTLVAVASATSVLAQLAPPPASLRYAALVTIVVAAALVALPSLAREFVRPRASSADPQEQENEDHGFASQSAEKEELGNSSLAYPRR